GILWTMSCEALCRTSVSTAIWLSERKGATAMSDLHTALEQIVFARRYTLGLLADVAPADWFRMPAEGVTHIAWPVGHPDYAQYRLVLERVRGKRDDDAELISGEFLQLFGRNSVPDPDPARYPDPAEIRTVLDRVYERVVRDLPAL